MDLAEIKTIIESLKDKRLQKAMKHKDWDAAYEAIIATMESKGTLDDSTPQGQFLEVISQVTFSVERGKLWAEESGTDPYEWKDGEWNNEGEDEDDE